MRPEFLRPPLCNLFLPLLYIGIHDEHRPESYYSMDQVQNVFTLSVFTFFVARYPLFVYNPTVSAYAQFNLLSQLLNWGRAQVAEARALLDEAMVEQFDQIYGTDVNGLAGWQKLCFVLAIRPIPNDLEECRKRVCATHVNICDLIWVPWLGLPPIFASEVDLSKYTLANGKVFPRSKVKRGSLLEYLLRHIYHPRRWAGKQKGRLRSTS
ncbi:hypothetical protein PYCCODRAFT_874973 [Trametes coccinea BRFM310]|uniref:Uncharacterized protein n=1 Tax=Trametes coccinea (strain BRFM310) TaxID=1353009 RepID=A0A1Y2IDN5_TRAC3|nr:hypothetical protein PYCCODRAFT_874973 [Trametes coccinea BRFM310]